MLGPPEPIPKGEQTYLSSEGKGKNTTCIKSFLLRIFSKKILKWGWGIYEMHMD